jgi:hypothetical protein
LKLKGATVTDRDLIAFACDLRLLPLADKYLTPTEISRMFHILQVDYVEYFVSQSRRRFVPKRVAISKKPLPKGIVMRQAITDGDSGLAAEESLEQFDDSACREAGYSNFQRVRPLWKALSVGIDWVQSFPEMLEGKKLEDIDFLDDLLQLNMGELYAGFDSGIDAEYGFMFCYSMTVLGRSLASSYAERINSAAALIMTDGRTLLGKELLEMCVLLRMNKVFMRFMRATYPDIALELVAAHKNKLAAKAKRARN